MQACASLNVPISEPNFVQNRMCEIPRVRTGFPGSVAATDDGEHPGKCRGRVLSVLVDRPFDPMTGQGNGGLADEVRQPVCRPGE